MTRYIQRAYLLDPTYSKPVRVLIQHRLDDSGSFLTFVPGDGWRSVLYEGQSVYGVGESFWGEYWFDARYPQYSDLMRLECWGWLYGTKGPTHPLP